MATSNSTTGGEPRFRVGSWVDDTLSAHRAGAAVVGGEVVADLRRDLEAAVAERVADLDDDAKPLRLPKARVTDLLTCERHALAKLGGDGELSEALVRGRLVDVAVTRHLVDPWPVGIGPDELAGEVHDALAAAGDAEIDPWLLAAGDEVRHRVWGWLAGVADTLAEGWGPVAPAWWPRTQDSLDVSLAQGSVVCGARFDVVLGGGPSGRPVVVIEVKSGSVRDHHRRDLGWYALLAALRFGVAPARVATWSAADDALVPLEVTEGVLESAARRGLDALDVAVRLAGGEVPGERAGPACGWCPELDRCTTGLDHLRAGEADAGDGGAEGEDADGVGDEDGDDDGGVAAAGAEEEIEP